jgi:hypothetical protein
MSARRAIAVAVITSSGRGTSRDEEYLILSPRVRFVYFEVAETVSPKKQTGLTKCQPVTLLPPAKDVS